MIDWDFLQQEGPPDPLDEEEDWARDIGIADGCLGMVSEEGSGAFRGRFRSTYISNYWDGFMQRKLCEGRMSEDEFYFYDPYPGRWGAYWEEM